MFKKRNLLYIQSFGFLVLSSIPRPNCHQNFSRIFYSRVRPPGKPSVKHFLLWHYCYHPFFVKTLLLSPRNYSSIYENRYTSFWVIMPLCERFCIVSITMSLRSWQGRQKINSYLRMSHNLSARSSRLFWNTVILFSAIAIGLFIWDCNSAYKAVTENTTRLHYKIK